MTDTRFTKREAVSLIRAACDATGGAFAFGYTRSDTDGTVYVDGVRQKVWRGRNASRRACAYYVGAASAWLAATGAAPTVGDLPAFLHAEQIRAYAFPADWREGQEDANHRAYRSAAEAQQ